MDSSRPSLAIRRPSLASKKARSSYLWNPIRILRNMIPKSLRSVHSNAIAQFLPFLSELSVYKDPELWHVRRAPARSSGWPKRLVGTRHGAEASRKLDEANLSRSAERRRGSSS